MASTLGSGDKTSSCTFRASVISRRTARTGCVHQNQRPLIQPDRICLNEVRGAREDARFCGCSEAGRRASLYVTSPATFAAVSAGLNGGGRTSSDASEGEITALLFMTCSLRSAGTGSHNGSPHHPSFSPPMPVPLARTFFIFFTWKLRKAALPSKTAAASGC